MGDKTAIQWTESSWTPIRARNLSNGKIGWFCEHATPGCQFCYSESMNRRLGTGIDFKPGHRAEVDLFLDSDMLMQPLRWKRPRMIFVCSMTDLFADFVKDEWIDRMLAVMALRPDHTFQVLTKRPERMRHYMAERHSRNEVELAAESIYASKGRPTSPKWCFQWPLPNVWSGTSVEDQRRADERIPILLETPAAVRFLSVEPMLGPVDLSRHIGPHHFTGNKIDWTICGGESGARARLFNLAWARSLRDQCVAAGVPFFLKQLGSKPVGNSFPLKHSKGGDMEEFPADLRIRQMPGEVRL